MSHSAFQRSSIRSSLFHCGLNSGFRFSFSLFVPSQHHSHLFLFLLFFTLLIIVAGEWAASTPQDSAVTRRHDHSIYADVDEDLALDGRLVDLLVGGKEAMLHACIVTISLFPLRFLSLCLFVLCGGTPYDYAVKMGRKKVGERGVKEAVLHCLHTRFHLSATVHSPASDFVSVFV